MKDCDRCGAKPVKRGYDSLSVIDASMWKWSSPFLRKGEQYLCFECLEINILCLVPTGFMDIDDLEWPGKLWDKQGGYNHYDVVIIDPSHNFDKHDTFNLPNLKLVITASTGTNHIDMDACASSGIDVLSLLDDRDGLNEIRASSEFTFFLILAALRKLHVLAYNITGIQPYANKDALRGNELYGKTVGIIGLGRIGSNIYRWVKAFGANVKHIYDPTVTGTTLENVFEGSDIVVISCALNETTIDMIRGSHVRLLKTGAVLVNSARGEIIQENELVDALQERPDLIYATDVLAGETKGHHKNSPLLGMTNVICTPHVAGLTLESNEKAFRITNKLLWEWYGRNKDVYEGPQESD